MVSELHLAIAGLHSSRVFFLTCQYLLFHLILASQVHCMKRDNYLRYHQCPQRERISQYIWRCAVYLPRYDTSTVTHCLLQTDGKCTPVLRRHVNVQPGHVQTDTSVDSHTAEVGCKVFYGVAGDGQEENVADYAEDVCD